MFGSVEERFEHLRIVVFGYASVDSIVPTEDATNEVLLLYVGDMFEKLAGQIPRDATATAQTEE